MNVLNSMAVDASLSPLELLQEAWACRLSVFARDSRLVVQGPADSDKALVQALLARKAELLPIVTLRDDDEREWFEERAAIAEFDGGLDRASAERQTWESLVTQRLYRAIEPSS
jgi:hypothetical protein